MGEPSPRPTAATVRTDIHLCKRCHQTLAPGQEAVSLADGMVFGGEEFHVANRRFYHTDCWREELDEHAGGADG